MRLLRASLIPTAALLVAGLVMVPPPAAAVGTVDITAPVELSALTGAVELIVASDQPSVRIESLTAIGEYDVVADIPVVDGAATWTWRTWGWPDGPVYLRATGCPTACDQTDEVLVTVSNAHPVLHKPAGTTFSGPMTFTADAPEGGVLFLLGGIRVFDAEAPYSATVSTTDMRDGLRTGTAYSCGLRGWCGNGSNAVTWNALSLHPSIREQPQPFSPDGDGVQDAASLRYRLPTASGVWLEVVSDDDGSVVRGPVGVGLKAAGTWSWTWKGYRDDGSRAPDGRYRIRLLTRAGGLYGKATSLPFALDTHDPVVNGVSGDSAVYPVADSYRDAFVARATADDRPFLTRFATLTIRNSEGVLVRRITKPTYGDGAQRITWYGRTSSGAIVPAGIYTWRVSMRDASGNVGYGPVREVRVSHKRLVETSFVVDVPASQAVVTVSSGAEGCAAATASSFGASGLRLTNDCWGHADGDPRIEAAYTVTLPRAVSYLGLRAEIYARTHASGAFYAWVSPDGLTRISRSLTAGASASWIRFADGSGYVRADRSVLLGLGLVQEYSLHDLDAKALRVTVYAQVLG